MPISSLTCFIVAIVSGSVSTISAKFRSIKNSGTTASFAPAPRSTRSIGGKDEGDIYGDGVNIAARLEALAEPGEICVSRVVRDQVRDKLDIFFEDGGEQRVKNIARPVHVYRIPIAGRVSASARQKGHTGFGTRPAEVGMAAPAETFVGRQRELEVLRSAF